MFMFPQLLYQYGEILNTILIIIFINILLVIFLISKKIKKNNILVLIIIIIYFLFMIFVPVYKLEDHEHIFNNDMFRERIIEYKDYYNIYGIRLKRNYKVR